MLLPVLPVITLASALPVPLMRRRAGQRQVLDLALGMNRIRQAEGDRRLHRVGAVAAGLVGHVAGIVHHIGVVARAAKHRVSTGPAIQRVVAVKAGQRIDAGIAGEDVVQVIAGAIDGSCPGQRQVLDLANGMNRVERLKLMRDCTVSRAIATGLVNHVASIVHHIGVVAQAADHRVGTHPPFSVSLPARPVSTLLPVVPVSVSLKAEPVRFSKPVSVSLPAPGCSGL